MEPRYCLSSGYSFVDTDIQTNTAFTAGLLNNLSGEVLLLNEELYALLRLFQRPAFVADAATQLASKLDAPFSDVQAVVEAAVDTYLQQGILTLVMAELLREKVAYIFPCLKPRTKIKEYSVLKELSTTPPVGVYLVRNQAGKRYILKKIFIDPNVSREQTRAQKKEFTYEFQVLDRLKECPLVNRLAEFDPDEGIGVIDYFAGASLRTFMTRNPDLPTLDRIELFSQVLDVMASLHSRKVLHGDLHSSNVLVNKKNRIKLIDFDMAFFWRDRMKNRVKYGGITDFIPPERLTNDVFHQSAGPPDFRAEVYQIGVIGYFIFHNKLPFVGTTWRQQVAAIRCAAPIWEVSAPGLVRSSIERALDKNPARRFASAKEMNTVWRSVDLD